MPHLTIYPAMFEITGGIPEPIIDELEEAWSHGENDTPLLEVRRCGDGHPPVTKRERDIRLNGTSGVKFQKPGSRTSIRVFFSTKEQTLSTKRRRSNTSNARSSRTK